MYTVGIWFVHLMNVAILAIVAVIVFVWMNVKRGQYLREATTCIQGELISETGHSEYYTVPCKANDEWVKIGNKRYKLDTKRRRWGVHPRIPFIGIKSLQVPIRKETWYKDDPNPAYRIKRDLKGKTEELQILTESQRQEAENVLTAGEVDAMVREETATQAAIEAVEQESRQKQLVEALANQANKTVAYVMWGIMILGIIILVINQVILT